MNVCMIRSRCLSALGVALALIPSASQAQMPGVPVLQNAFANPGITVGLNYGRGTDVTGYAVAGAWAPGSARFVVSGGLGAVKVDGAGESSTAYGGRVAVPVKRFMDDAAGVGVFGGYGGAEGTNTSVAVLGLSAGYRRPMGTLGVSIHVAPSYQRYRASVGGDAETGGAFRFSGGVDVSFGARFGATVGFEAGGKAGAGEPGPTGSMFGMGVSYALRRVR